MWHGLAPTIYREAMRTVCAVHNIYITLLSFKRKLETVKYKGMYATRDRFIKEY